MARKGENIYKRKDGRYEGRYIKDYDLQGTGIIGYVYGKTYKEDEQIAVPENGERVIQHPLGFAFDGLVLFGDTNQIPFQEKEGSSGADKACENEQKDGKHELKIKIAADFGNPVARCHYFFSI